METATRPKNFVEGENYPSPVTHVIGLDYCDGLVSGLLKTVDGSAYTFEMVEEERNPDGLDFRTYELTPLPADTFDQVTELLERHLGPRRPYWVPVWTFPSGDAQAATEAALDRALVANGKPSWRVAATDLTETVSAAHTS
ncbi:hypothetical protein GobsT_02760 [Gemmata obscuriglobus]|uniref:Uncharacterized protein n=1 Tax=Gemmata obscuriglobus TaxID=114 RepID=A0A2Z3HBK3_9BACT|nr:hypothetical protein [Gemmata obscuriglobus]AWM41116.1 hypothetical protein C1280_31775 [Gemmata obscuriglobus]QEG25549.1 hypothetical protein GobsT_02760 [Gemmata obscuriglobus]VTR98917.1 unnamed protein product [Gemmata obscuriglobus UQM 2246]